jgi:hypothetical protein
VTAVLPSAPAELLARAGDVLPGDDSLTEAARHLIACAAGVVGQLGGEPDLPAAQQALGHARAAVVAATYAVRTVHERGRA